MVIAINIIGLGLIAAILITWLALTGPSKEQIEKAKQDAISRQDSIDKSNRINEETKLVEAQKTQDTIAKISVSDSILQLAK